jgi:transposase
MGHVEGISRDQRQLLAPSLDEIVGADHVVRVIDGYVDSLDLGELGFSKFAVLATGRPPFHPAALLKLYLYGYLNQTRSSRRLEREAVRNIEVRWLINQLEPSFRTIAAFRQEHSQAIVAVTRSFVRFCRSLSLYGCELVAIDGTKIEAAASRKKVVTPKKLAKQLAAIDARIAAYLAEMDAADQAEGDRAEGGPQAGSAGDVQAALEVLAQRRAEVQSTAKALVDEGLTQKVIGESDARLMKTARHGHQVCYNAQTAVDGKHGLIAAFELTNAGNDLAQLQPMAEAAKAELDAETLTVVADTGYSNGEQGNACEQAGITPVVPRPAVANPKNKDLFGRDRFHYDEDSDSWTCPSGETLTRYKSSQTGQTDYYTTSACATCALKAQCTKSASRSIARGFHEKDKEAMHRRAIDEPAYMKRRRELVEHPFGNIKWMLGYPRFLLRGIEKAKSELALAVFAFNLKRIVKILGVQAILAALQPRYA